MTIHDARILFVILSRRVATRWGLSADIAAALAGGDYPAASAAIGRACHQLADAGPLCAAQALATAADRIRIGADAAEALGRAERSLSA